MFHVSTEQEVSSGTFGRPGSRIDIPFVYSSAIILTQYNNKNVKIPHINHMYNILYNFYESPPKPKVEDNQYVEVSTDSFAFFNHLSIVL